MHAGQPAEENEEECPPVYVPGSALTLLRTELDWVSPGWIESSEGVGIGVGADGLGIDHPSGYGLK